MALAGQHVEIVTALARAYTRGRGFVGTEPEEDVAAVITTATARLLANPSQAVLEQTPVFTRRPGVFAGWTLVELFVLNRYRKRAA